MIGSEGMRRRWNEIGYETKNSVIFQHLDA